MDEGTFLLNHDGESPSIPSFVSTSIFQSDDLYFLDDMDGLNIWSSDHQLPPLTPPEVQTFFQQNCHGQPRDVATWTSEECYDLVHNVCSRQGLDMASVELTAFSAVTGREMVSYTEANFCCLLGSALGVEVHREVKRLLRAIPPGQQQQQQQQWWCGAVEEQVCPGDESPYAGYEAPCLYELQEVGGILPSPAPNHTAALPTLSSGGVSSSKYHLPGEDTITSSTSPSPFPSSYPYSHPSTPVSRPFSSSTPSASPYLSPNPSPSPPSPRPCPPSTPISPRRRETRREGAGRRSRQADFRGLEIPRTCFSFPVDPLEKIISNGRRREREPKNWEYLVRLMLSAKYNPSWIQWEDLSDGTFRLVQKEAIARMFGARRGQGKAGCKMEDEDEEEEGEEEEEEERIRQWGVTRAVKKTRRRRNTDDKLSYDNFARGLRYHYNKGALEAVSERQLVYRWGPKAIRFFHDEVSRLQLRE